MSQISPCKRRWRDHVQDLETVSQRHRRSGHAPSAAGTLRRPVNSSKTRKDQQARCSPARRASSSVGDVISKQVTSSSSRTRKPLGEISLAQADRQGREIQQRREAAIQRDSNTSQTGQAQDGNVIAAFAGGFESVTEDSLDGDVTADTTSASQGLPSTPSDGCVLTDWPYTGDAHNVCSSHASPSSKKARSAIGYQANPHDRSRSGERHCGGQEGVDDGHHKPSFTPLDENDDSPGRERRHRCWLQQQSDDAISSPTKARSTLTRHGMREANDDDDDDDDDHTASAELQRGPRNFPTAPGHTRGSSNV